MFTKPKTDISNTDILFGPDNIRNFIPGYKDIPDEFKEHTNLYCKFISKWFYNGLDKEDIDQLKSNSEEYTVDQSLKHIKVIMSSWDISHEHKISGCGYLLSKWCTLEKV